MSVSFPPESFEPGSSEYFLARAAKFEFVTWARIRSAFCLLFAKSTWPSAPFTAMRMCRTSREAALPYDDEFCW